MADGRPAYDPDRLPWLVDQRRPRRARDSTALLLWALLATLLVGGVSYWLGMQSVRETADAVAEPSPAATVTLPEPVARQPEPEPAPLPEVEPVVEPAPVPIPRAEPVRVKPELTEKPRARPSGKPKARAAPPRKAPPRRATQLRAWPASQSAGAHGRIVRVGTFYSRRQAKQGWSRIVRVYPGMRRLNAVVVPNPSLRTGQTFYRLQFGTTSQAHSAVLCQRMRIVGQSCVVVGLPANPGGTRR